MAERKSTKVTKRLAICAALTALALIFSYVEVLIPFSFGIPGIKLGLANIVVLISIYTLGPKYGLFINIARICLSALMFGNTFSALYALSGGLLSLAVMLLTKKAGVFSVIGVSMAGGVFHNLGQLMVAVAVMQTVKIMYYFPVLLISGMITGILTGFIAALVLRALRQVSYN